MKTIISLFVALASMLPALTQAEENNLSLDAGNAGQWTLLGPLARRLADDRADVARSTLPSPCMLTVSVICNDKRTAGQSLAYQTAAFGIGVEYANATPWRPFAMLLSDELANPGFMAGIGYKPLRFALPGGYQIAAGLAGGIWYRTFEQARHSEISLRGGCPDHFDITLPGPRCFADDISTYRTEQERKAVLFVMPVISLRPAGAGFGFDLRLIPASKIGGQQAAQSTNLILQATYSY